MTILTSENFDREVLNSDKPVVVDFWATWCGPCMMLSPIMEELDGEMPDVKFCKLNVDDERDLAIEYGVQSIPMLLCGVLCDLRLCTAPKPPLCKGRWHGEAVTEGLSTIDGLNPLRRCAPNACGHSGVRL